MTPLLAWSQDDILANRSGYHVLADYLPSCPHVIAPRRDPASIMGRLRAKVLRRFAFSRWCVGGSFAMEAQITQRIDAGYVGPIHYLWCDRDLGFLDRQLNAAKNPLIGTFHQCADVLPQAIRRTSSLPKFAAIIIMSETQRAWFKAQGVKSERIHRILHGVDIEHFTPAADVPTDQCTVLAVGGTHRNFGLLCDVAKTLSNETMIRFEVVGPPNKKAMFTGLTNLVYHDRLTDAELLSKYQQATCLLHLIEDSTANNVINEALACGTPIISERHGGVPEYVTDDCAILCAPKNGASVVAAIKAFVGSRERQQSMRIAARAHALTFDWRIIAKQTEQLYQTLN